MNKLQKIIAIGTALTTIIWMSGAAYLAPVATAATAEEIQASIDALMAELAALQTQLSALEGTSTATYEGIPADFTFTKFLKRGSKGDEVKYLQIVLQTEVGKDVVGAADGSFGKMTDAAVKKFQTANSLVSDGLVGAKSRAVLNAKLAAVPPVVAELTVASISPAKDATKVAVGSNVAVTLSMALDSATVTADSVKLAAGANAVAATTTVSDKVITIDPTADLAENTTYTVTLTTDVKATDGTALKAEYSSSFSTGETVTPPPTGVQGIKVSRSDDQPATTIVPLGATNVSFLNLDLTAGSESATVSEIVLKRDGVGATTDFVNVYLYSGNTRLTNGKSVGSTTHEVTFPNINLVVNANTTKTLTVVAEINTSGTGNADYFMLESASKITATKTIEGTFPIKGNVMTLGGQSVASLTLAKVTNPSNPTVGQENTQIAKFSITGGTRDVNLERITLIQAGTISATDLTNLNLYATSVTDSNKLASTAALNGDKMEFVLSPAYVVPQGTTKTFIVTATIAGRSSRTIRTYLEYTTDLKAIDSIYLQSARIGTNGYDGSSSSNYSEVTTQGGKVSIAFNGPTTGNVAKGSQDVVLYKFAMSASDQNIEVRNVAVTIAKESSGDGKVMGSTNNTFTDIKIMNADTGKIVAGPKEYSVLADATTSGTMNFTDYFYISAGQTLNLNITADIRSTEDTAADFINDGFQVTLGAFGATAVKEQDTPDYIATTSIVPNVATTGNTMTIVASSLTVTLASTPASHNVVKKQTGDDLVAFVFQAGSDSAAKISDLTLTGKGDVGDGSYAYAEQTAAQLDDAVTKATLWVDGAQIGAVSGSSPNTSGEIAFSNLNWEIPAGASKTLTVKVDYASSIGDSNDDYASVGINVAADITATDKDNNSITATDGDSTWSDPKNDSGSAITVYATIKDAGTLTAGAVGTPVATDNVLASTNDVTFTQVKFISQFEAFTIEKLQILSDNVDYNDNFGTVTISYPDKDGNPKTATGTISGASPYAALFSGLAFYVPKDGSAVLTVKANVNSITVGADSGDQPALDFDYDTNFKAVGVASGTTKTSAGSANVTGNPMIVRKALSTITPVALPKTVMQGNGEYILSKVNIEATGDEISWKRLVWTVNGSFNNIAIGGNDTTPTTNAITTALSGAADDVSVIAASTMALYNSGTGSTVSGTFYVENAASASYIVFVMGANAEEKVSVGSSKTYELRATISTAFSATGTESISTKIAMPNTSATTDVYATVRGTADSAGAVTEGVSFVWSDLSVYAHDVGTTVDASADWTHDYKVKTLPSSSQVISE